MTSINDTSLVLVAILPSPRDLEIARLLGWYRIPLRTAPKVISVDYLAFYQTGSFGSERWRIRYIAPVLGHELVTRAELLQEEEQHPRAREEYIKVQIGPLEELPHPILADKWRRITFLYTIGDYLKNATTINDLVIHSEERQTLWKSLRERASIEPIYGEPDLPGLDINPTVLAIILGLSTYKGDVSETN